jgi:hypothetical protein
MTTEERNRMLYWENLNGMQYQSTWLRNTMIECGMVKEYIDDLVNIYINRYWIE